MPAGRMTLYRKRTTRRVARRTGRGRSSVRRANRAHDTYYFKRSFAQIAPGAFSGNAAYTPYLNAYSFNLAQLPNVADFTALFDRYMITHIQLRFYLKIDPSAQTASTASYPKLYYVKDYDDASAPGSLDVLREHSRCVQKVLHPNRPVIVNIKPAVLHEVFRTGVLTSYSPKWKQYIDMANTNVEHYGLKWGIDDFTNTNYKLDIEGKMWFQCKDIR